MLSIYYFIFVVLCSTLKEGSCFKYLGCYEEQSPTDRLMKGYAELEQSDLTIETCFETCNSRNFRFAGLQNKEECYCSNEPPPEGKLKKYEDCVSKCTGNEYQHCGGIYRISIYDLKETHAQKYIGCYLEVNQNPPNPLFKGHVEKHASGLTVTKCMNICKRRKFKYAGLKNGFECYCSHEKPSFSRIAPDSECSSKCSGSKEMCGAPNRLSVYDSNEPQQSRNLGCYKEKLKKDKLMDDIVHNDVSDLTASKCRSLCEPYNVRFFGLQKGTECLCSNRIPPPTFSAPLQECNQKCSGNNQKCGGNKRLTVYDTQALGSFSYIGCYKEASSDKKVVSDLHRFFIGTLTPELCVRFCKEIYLFKFAATQNGNKCFCVKETPSYQLSAPEEECSVQCEGDLNEKCGGVSHLSVYRYIDTAETSESHYVGCYTKTGTGMNSSFFISNTLTQDYCVGSCFQKKYSYAGIMDGRNCFCGNSFDGLTQEDDTECDTLCPGNPKAFCGGTDTIGLFRTSSNSEPVPSVTVPQLPDKTGECKPSPTTVNGGNVCQGAVVFQETFKPGYSDKLWIREVYIPDEEFVVYTHLDENMKIKNGVLQIIPTMMTREEVFQNLKLLSCTKLNSEAHLCEKEAKSFSIIPPIKSGQLTTREKFAFKYGKINIRARLPQGDWLFPEIHLVPKDTTTYGPLLMSGRIVIAMSRGNDILKLNLDDIGTKSLQSGILIGPTNYEKEKLVRKVNREGWHKKFHNFTFTWTPESISFGVDGENELLIVDAKKPLGETMKFSATIKEFWYKGTYLAPFDEEFYLHIGLAAGGLRWFPDDIVTGNLGHVKPWKNIQVKALANFYQDRENWSSTWNKNSKLEIDEVTITAL